MYNINIWADGLPERTDIDMAEKKTANKNEKNEKKVKNAWLKYNDKQKKAIFDYE